MDRIEELKEKLRTTEEAFELAKHFMRQFESMVVEAWMERDAANRKLKIAKEALKDIIDNKDNYNWVLEDIAKNAIDEIEEIK